MDKTALFKLSYGLFVVGVQESGRENGCVINTAAQATDTPCRMLVTMQKQNLTTQMIIMKKSFTVSVLSVDCPLAVVEQFGYRSGRDVDKFAGGEYLHDGKGNPYLKNGTVAYMSCTVESVSYTHLDVYKRQHSRASMHSSGFAAGPQGGRSPAPPPHRRSPWIG